METGKIFRDSQIIVLGVCIAVATVAASLILAKGFMAVVKFNQQVVTVTGSAQKNIKSDKIVWKAIFSRRERDLPSGYKKVQEDLDKVKKYLMNQGVVDSEIIIQQIVSDKVYKKTSQGKDTNEIDYYALIQPIEVWSNQVDKVTAVSRGSTELINQNIAFESGAPEYYYTKLDELKIEMLALATENAKRRAENMVKATGNKIGFIRSARMGIFQITPVNSTEVSDYGVNDTTSLEKKVTAVVNAGFSIE
ncbi:MAG: SIMPL domain-containing protein [Candidatus Omnitrophota bacterium]|nr:SIMPL domain-containing protein [Candidatus Omnitrophota bacterium]